MITISVSEIVFLFEIKEIICRVPYALLFFAFKRILCLSTCFGFSTVVSLFKLYSFFPEVRLN